MKNLKGFIDSINVNGGCSYNINTGEINPNSGYFVSIAGAEKVVTSLTEETVKQYIEDNIDLLITDRVYLGGWFNEGLVYLDCSQQIEELKTAVRKGIERGQLAIFNAETKESIYLPSAQKCGTEYQKRSYIDYSVNRLVLELENCR